jgi:NosR/NirI family nitrous oxide reductase transcriptional regulator
MGKPAYVEAYRSAGGEKKLAGYVFLSTDIVDIPAYSGKPVITLIGMDTKGIITGTRILRHSEPILLLGIPESVLTKFVKQYLGKFVGDKIEIGKSRNNEGYIGLDAISGATVTVIAQNQVIMRSGVAIARQVGILKVEPKPAIRFAGVDERLGWQQLVEEGSIRRLTVRPEQVGKPRAPEPHIDMHFGYLNTPSVGKSILGESGYSSLMSRLKDSEHAIFIIASGTDTFKGSGFVRGGIYDRIQIAQDMDAYTFRDLDYLNLWGIEAVGAPAYKESAIFIIRDPGFSGALPWHLMFLTNKLDQKTGRRDFVSFDSEYWVLDKYMQGGRPKVVKPDAPWLRVWKMRALEIGLFSALLIGVGVVYAMRDTLARRSTRKNKWPVNVFKYAAWIASIGFVGFGLLAQPSITQVLTWFHSLLFQWTVGAVPQRSIHLPVLDLHHRHRFRVGPRPVLWLAVPVRFAVRVALQGGQCGWPQAFPVQAVPMALHNWLKWVKYAVFFGLLAVSVFSMGLAEKLAEVEPFKTTFLVGMFNRSWPYALFAAGLLALSIFTERPFCKYLCPLGAALAMPTTFRWFGLKRKQECDTCHACAKGCGSLAIDTPTAASTRANACCASTAWCCTPMPTPVRRWPGAQAADCGPACR